MTARTSPQPGLEEHFEVVQEKDEVGARKIVAIFVGAIVITIVSVWVQSKLLDAKRAGRSRAMIAGAELRADAAA